MAGRFPSTKLIMATPNLTPNNVLETQIFTCQNLEAFV